MGEFMTETTAQRMFAESFPELVTTTQDKNAVRITQTMWRVAVSNPTNDIFNPNKVQRYMEMSYPLSHYLIFSSFQTYALVHKEKNVIKEEKSKKPKSPRLQLYAPGAAFLYKNVVDPLIQKVKESSPLGKSDSKDGASSPAAQEFTTRDSVGMGVRPEQLGEEEDVIPEAAEEDDIPPAESTDPVPAATTTTGAISNTNSEDPTAASNRLSLAPVSPGAGDGVESTPASPRDEIVEIPCEPSVARYRADLLRGCRYIEIDVVDGAKEPVVCMGQSVVTVKGKLIAAIYSIYLCICTNRC